MRRDKSRQVQGSATEKLPAIVLIDRIPVFCRNIITQPRENMLWSSLHLLRPLQVMMQVAEVIFSKRIFICSPVEIVAVKIVCTGCELLMGPAAGPAQRN